ncbi:hypothetical protein AKJ50_00960 [candidate division MSBL1 archaeon SCGC-AAA382A13]|uniref:Flavin reductase like domain-containing protein n=2 Tax=candidate division MSBL1 TaxID=215777 RepID=A0A133VEB6_9EURY|nr:hypothetical protein AKJ49_01715 [candidate division MSBL1 archaeon SCGC-AAA382A03]KXB05440.1 hypothetical protein AKJ50_00960 [candidate division MSBL1 archaeon SCGC-AAA382A13]
MKINNNDFYKMIAPRPTVCVSTISDKGNSNIAPYSFATPLSFSPPLLGIAVGEGKDTIVNARQTKDFVVAPLTKNWSEKGVQTEISLPREKSEFKKIGLTEADSKKVKSPSIAEASINIECEYEDEFKTGDHFLLVGKVVYMSVDEDSIKNDRINLERLGTIGHITGEEFCISSETVQIERQKS